MRKPASPRSARAAALPGPTPRCNDCEARPALVERKDVPGQMVYSCPECGFVASFKMGS